MGHVRLKRLPASKKWHQVVALLAGDASIADVASASARAAETGLQRAWRDPVLAHSFWLLTQLPLAARAPDFAAAARAVGVDVGAMPTLMEVVTAFSDGVDRATAGQGGRTDLGEMARGAAVESLSDQGPKQDAPRAVRR